MRIFRRDADRGAALPVVIGLGLVLMIAVAGGLGTAVSGLRQASTDQDQTGALDAAYAGVQDYLAHLNTDAAYGGYGNSVSSFSVGSTVTLPTGTAANPAFAIGRGAAWATVPTASGQPTTCAGTGVPCFRYEVDNRLQAAAGILRVRSTGRLGSTVRSIVANVKRQGFVNYLYFTDYETQDPVISGLSGCEMYAWAGSRDAACTINFGSADVLAGPVHSNDTISACATTFQKLVTTANPNTPSSLTQSGCAAAKFQVKGSAQQVAKVDLPQTNTAMQSQTRSDLVATTGCLYTGPTVVTYNGDGYMTVWSPWTKYTSTSATSLIGTNDSKCGVPGTQSGQLGNATGARVRELDQNLLYVQGVPPIGDPNYSPTIRIPTGMTCYGPDGTTSTLDAASSVGWKFGPWAFPMAGEAAPDGWDSGKGLYNAMSNPTGWSGSGTWSTSLPAYNCRNGDLFVKGKVTTQTTAASDGYVYVIGDLTVQDATQDVLGLVGQNAVLVYNPLNASKASLLPSTDTGREIDAAILSVSHTFQVQNFNLGPPRGVLTVVGSIAQKFRGPVATTTGTAITTGYSKSYQYDDLLGKVPPPYFLSPSTTNFLPQRYVSVPQVFAADGTVK